MAAAAASSLNHTRLQDIIAATHASPTIVNPQSRFVIVTYWWGRGNYNQNTARPCVAFYEDFFMSLQKLCVTVLLQLSTKQRTGPLLLRALTQLSAYRIKFLQKFVRGFLHMLFQYTHVTFKWTENADVEAALQQANAFIRQSASASSSVAVAANEHKEQKEQKEAPLFEQAFHVPQSYDDVARVYTEVVVEFVMQNIDELNQLANIQHEIHGRRAAYKKTQEAEELLSKMKASSLTARLDALTKKKAALGAEIMRHIKTKHEWKNINGMMNLFDYLNRNFRVIAPLKFEDMIAKWEAECLRAGCNYMAVEYPEFAAPGGYQLAINAKPLFIQKALELCGDRAVVYIDGDMFVRHYPHLFDIEDVDFMARGWWIDPRSSYNISDSILVDPYTFETSGGIMYFSQSVHSHQLLNTWIEFAANPTHRNKADDRVLSLVFNARRFLLSMKIIQLPVEYLWLSQDYDERMLEVQYNYNEQAMRQSILVEHPECLTSEESARGAGAASDRTPKFYGFLGDHMVPTSEAMHEFLMFPTKDMANAAFGSYVHYLNGATYLDDGNEDLYRLGFVRPGQEPNTEYNDEFEAAQPIYVIPYDSYLGTTPSMDDSDVTVSELSRIHMKRVEQFRARFHNNALSADFVRPLKGHRNTVILQPDPEEMPSAVTISMILFLLSKGQSVVYCPAELDEDDPHYVQLVEHLDDLYKSMEFVFVPIYRKNVVLALSDMFRVGVRSDLPMLFRPGCHMLTYFLSMFGSFDSFSDALMYGSYEFISRVRIAYLAVKVPKKTQGGGSGSGRSSIIEQFLQNQYQTLKELVELTHRTHRRRHRTHRRRHRTKQRKQTRRKN